jgi:Ca-activated chloride channel family protein
MVISTPLIAAACVFAVTLIAEWLHARRIRRVAILAFGRAGKAAPWTIGVPFVRSASLALLTWGLITLYVIDPRVMRPSEAPEASLRRILLLLDVSPSMQLTDAGIDHKQTRARRASDVVMSILDRVVLEQAKVTVVAFYSTAKPVVVDAKDPNVIKNILNDLPLDQAFEIGKTSIPDGLREAYNVAKPWREKSTTLLVVTDGDTVPATGLPVVPPSIDRTFIIGVGDPRVGKFIDGHQSRQDASTLRQLAARLKATYHDGNEKHLPSETFAELSEALPITEKRETGRREAAIAASVAGGLVTALIPLALGFAGSRWQPGRRKAMISSSGRNETAPASSKSLAVPS